MAVFNALAGLVIAWVLVRDEFPGSRWSTPSSTFPSPYPTVVAGLTLLTLYGPDSPSTSTWPTPGSASCFALAFVTLPFSRALGPAGLGRAGPRDRGGGVLARGLTGRVLRRIILPSVAPAMLAGAGLAFARAIGEFGSVVLISGNLPFKTEVASSWIYSLSQSDQLTGGGRGLGGAHRRSPSWCCWASACSGAGSTSSESV